MTERPLVSIVTPTLNQGRFIEATIRSIKRQTFARFEHIVIDGGSTDETLDILRRHEGTYPLRWLSEPDRGMYDAVNKGMALARGDILAYLNSDDLYFPWTLEAVVEAFERHPEADVVFGDAMGISGQGRHDVRFQPPYRFAFLLYASSFVQPAVFWRRRVAEEVGPFDASMSLAGDLDFFLRMGPDRRFLRLHEVLAIERDHGLTKRASQWTVLLAESARSRAAIPAMSPLGRRVLRTVERFRAWAWKRALWLAFIIEARQDARHRPHRWPRFLTAGRVDIHLGRALLSQLPWLGRYVVAGAIRPAVNWTAGSEPTRAGGQGSDLRSPAGLEPDA
jgi:glycosyltransferase involved in cell wall biosynthesis